MRGTGILLLRAGEPMIVLSAMKDGASVCSLAVSSASDPQSVHVMELLQQPYRIFYDFKACWSIRQLEKICEEENIPLPRPDDR